MAGSITKGARRALSRLGRQGRTLAITHSPDWLKTALGPLALRMDMLFVDHGVFRVAYLNRHRIDEHAWRAAQPTPGQISRFKRLGIRTIVNLRGERECGSYWLETEACRRAGIKLVNFVARSREAPRREDIHAARKMFAEIEYPILMHCKSGADRAGIMSALYLILHRGVPVDVAARQLSLRFGHIQQADTGILDFMLARYLADNAKSPIDFLTWVDTLYDPVALRAEFRASGWANRLVNGILKRE